MTSRFDDAAFAAAMAAIGDFEPRPLLGLAVSGGADSMALALLAQRWAAARGGTCVALTVDHGLRDDSAAEAAAVGQALAAHGLRHEILRWDGAKPATGVEAAARAARYDLLVNRCRDLAALHLLTAHHAEDQRETVLLRLCRGSGPDGLAGMAAVRYLDHIRLLRPLLAAAPDDLRAVCRAAGLGWFDDPTNRGDGNARARLRRLAPLLAGAGLAGAGLMETARRAAAQRRLLEELTAALLARIATVSPYGYVVLARGGLLAADGELQRRALAAALRTVDGGAYPPRRAAVDVLLDRLRARPSGVTTLGGCLIRWRGAGGMAICREAAALEPPVPLSPGVWRRWDRRFMVCLAADAPADKLVGLAAGAAGAGGGPWRRLAIPGAARAALPVLLGDGAERATLSARFIPACPLAGACFPVVSAAGDII